MSLYDASRTTATTPRPTTSDLSGDPDFVGSLHGNSSTTTTAPMARSSAALAVLGVVLSLGTIAIGVVLLRDAVVAAGWLGGSLWTSAATDWVAGLTPSGLVVGLGLGLTVVGLWVTVQSLRPRPVVVVRLHGGSLVYLTSSDLRTVAKQAAEGVDGVLSSSVAGTPRALTVHVRTTGSATTGELVKGAVAKSVAALETRPSVRVRVSGGRS